MSFDFEESFEESFEELEKLEAEPVSSRMGLKVFQSCLKSTEICKRNLLRIEVHVKRVFSTKTLHYHSSTCKSI